jgi:hypothetical protein
VAQLIPDILINSIGMVSVGDDGMNSGDISDESRSLWNRALAARNLDRFHPTRALVPGMRGSGKNRSIVERHRAGDGLAR